MVEKVQIIFFDIYTYHTKGVKYFKICFTLKSFCLWLNKFQKPDRIHADLSSDYSPLENKKNKEEIIIKSNKN